MTHRTLGAAVGIRDPRTLLSRREIGELLSTGSLGLRPCTTILSSRPSQIADLVVPESIDSPGKCPPDTSTDGLDPGSRAQGAAHFETPSGLALPAREPAPGGLVVIPCRSEEMNLAPLVTALTGLFGEYVHEIIPVDDNSTDDTRAVMAALAARIRASSRYSADRPAVWAGRSSTATAPRPDAMCSRWTVTSSICCRKSETCSSGRRRFGCRHRQPVLAPQRPAQLPVQEDRGESRFPSSRPARAWTAVQGSDEQPETAPP